MSANACDILFFRRKNKSAQIPLPRIGEDGNYGFSCSQLPGQLERCPYIGPGADSGKYSGFPGQPQADPPGIIITDPDHLIDYFPVQYLGDKSGADPLNLMGARLPAGENR